LLLLQKTEKFLKKMNRNTRKGKEIENGDDDSKVSEPKGNRNFLSLIAGCLITVVIIVGVSFIGGNAGSSPNLREPAISQNIQVGDSVIHDPAAALVLNLSNSPKIPTPKSPTVVQPPPSQSLSFEEFTQVAEKLYARVDESLKWILHDEKAEYAYIRWDLIANADIHILFKIKQFLSHYLSSPANKKSLYQLFANGYECTPLHAGQQELISKFINMDICSEIEWYKLVQLTFPEAKTIFDVGGNKGYLGSLFLSLWGGNGLKTSPLELYQLAQSLNTWKNSRNPGGYCRDGFNQAIPLYCPDNAKNRDPKTGKCNIINEDVKVRSFDGSSYLRNTITNFIENHLFPLKDKKSGEPIEINKARQDMWKYFHHAVSNKEGTARFTKQSSEKNAGFEGGSIKTSVQTATDSKPLTKLEKDAASFLDETEEVKVITIDTYLSQNHMNRVDMLKIDTEGNDNKVLQGAQYALKQLTGVFTFEGGGGVAYTKEMDQEFHSLGYNCYSTTRAGLFKWNQNCMKEKYYGSFRRKDKGNIFCVHRIRAPLTALAFDIMTFPAMIDFMFSNTTNGPNFVSRLNKNDRATYHSLFENNVKSSDAKEVQLNPKTDQTTLLPLYVNIHGFCRPWPSCLSNL
jgi:FkbM family methyltransferase